MNPRQFTPVLILLGMAGAVAFAASSLNYTLDPVVIDQGGGTAFSANYGTRGSIGGSVIGYSDSAGYRLESDFGYTVLDGDDSGPPVRPPLLVTPGPLTPGPTVEANNVPGLSMLQIRLAAGSSAVTVNTLVITASGTGNDASVGSGGDVSQVYLFHDGNGNGLLDAGSDTSLAPPVFFSSDNGTASFTTIGRTIPASTFEHWIVVYDFFVAGTATKTFAAGVASSLDVSATDATTGNPIGVNGPPFTGYQKTFNPPAGSTGTLTVAGGPKTTPKGTAYPGEVTTAMQVQFAASSYEDIAVQSVTFKASGTGDDRNDVTEVSLYRDANSDGVLDGGDVQLGGPTTYLLDDDYISFAVSEVLLAGSAQNWILVYTFTEPLEAGLTFRASVQDSSSVTALGQNTLLSVTPMLVPVAPVSGPELTIGVPDPGGPSYFMGGCAGGTGSGGPAGVLGLLLLCAALVAGLRAARGTPAAGE